MAESIAEWFSKAENQLLKAAQLVIDPTAMEDAFAGLVGAFQS